MVSKATLAEHLLLVISGHQRLPSCSEPDIKQNRSAGRQRQKGQLEVEIKLGTKDYGNANQMCKSDSSIFLFNPKKDVGKMLDENNVG